ncbi:MAG: hypothetical protein M3406_06230 [Chloroflexota bacterium]|nr:hypothetical protein [Chloroflexota bacterium]
MRQRFRPLRARMMASRPDADGGGIRWPQGRWILGVIAAALLLGAAILAVQLLVANDEGTVPDSTPSGSAGSGTAVITFGTELDPATNEVAADARTDRFSEGDQFVYSVPAPETIPNAVYVEVRPAGDGSAAAVQDPVDAQPVTTTNAIAFSVQASALLADFGAGQFRMLIYADPAAAPIGDGTFTLVDTGASPESSP